MSRLRPDRALPAYAHRPGRTPHPLRDPAGHSFGVTSVPAPSFPAAHWMLCDDHCYAIDLFDAGYFWEAHESWEGLWKAATDPAVRDAIHALVQCSVALLHRDEGRRDAARTVADRACARMPDGLSLGVDFGALRRDLVAALDAAEGAPTPRVPLVVRSRDRFASATDRWVQAPETIYRELDGAVAFTTPAYIDFYDGHGLILDGAPRPDEIVSWLDRCRSEAGPGGRRRPRITWEDDDDRDIEAPHGLSVDTDVVLTTIRQPPPPARAQHVSLAAATGDADWDAILDIAVEHGREISPTAEMDAFSRWRVDHHRGRAESGDATWWIARQDGVATTTLGVYATSHVIRFQDVVTVPAQRGRGLATALVASALARSLERHPGARAVIVANQGSQAERIYRGLGFAPSGLQRWIRAPHR